MKSSMGDYVDGRETMYDDRNIRASARRPSRGLSIKKKKERKKNLS